MEIIGEFPERNMSGFSMSETLAWCRRRTEAALCDPGLMCQVAGNVFWDSGEAGALDPCEMLEDRETSFCLGHDSLCNQR